MIFINPSPMVNQEGQYQPSRAHDTTESGACALPCPNFMPTRMPVMEEKVMSKQILRQKHPRNSHQSRVKSLTFFVEKSEYP